MSTHAAGFLIGHLADEPERDVATLTPLIDGQSLAELVTRFEIEQRFDPAGGYDGMVTSSYRFGGLRTYLLGDNRHEEDKRYLLGCNCGELGCWPLMAVIGSDTDTVTWSGFAQPHRADRDYSAFGPFVFDRRQYDTALTIAVDALGADTDDES